jgi:hypothetical protein
MWKFNFVGETTIVARVKVNVKIEERKQWKLIALMNWEIRRQIFGEWIIDLVAWHHIWMSCICDTIIPHWFDNVPLFFMSTILNKELTSKTNKEKYNLCSCYKIIFKFQYNSNLFLTVPIIKWI